MACSKEQFANFEAGTYKNVIMAVPLTPFHERSRNIISGKPPERLLKIFLLANFEKERSFKLEFVLVQRSGKLNLHVTETRIPLVKESARMLLRSICSLEPVPYYEVLNIDGQKSLIDYRPFVNGQRAVLKRIQENKVDVIEFTPSELSVLITIANEFKVEMLTFPNCNCTTKF